MNKPLTTTEQHLLWMLVAYPEGGFQSDLQFVKAKSRDTLLRAGLLEVEKRIKPRGRSKTVTTYIRLSDAGWAWCNQNMSWMKPRGNAEKLLDSLLQRLKILFDRQTVASSLADFVNKSTPVANSSSEAPIEKATSTPAVPQHVKLDERIRAACLELGGGREAVRIRIADLRKRLADISADALNEGVRELSRRRELTLYPLDDPRQITPDDELAAIHSSTGVPQHILYYGGIAS